MAVKPWGRRPVSMKRWGELRKHRLRLDGWIVMC
jgi:hypothetical protein